MLSPAYWNQRIHSEIPATRLLGITIDQLSTSDIQVSAPFEVNKNGHQTAFAGSIYTLGITTGWTLISAILQYHQVSAAVVAGKAEIFYRKPILEKLQSRCQLNHAPLTHWQSIWQTERSARQELEIEIGDEKQPGAVLSATFYIKRL
jgi:thioesterase domain-containing protein